MRPMKYRLLFALPLCAALAGCSGGGNQDQGVQVRNAAWQQAMDAGQQALAIGRYSVAEREYREASRLALRDDDPQGIADSSYNLAVTQLSADKPTDALETVQNARAALEIRSVGIQAQTAGTEQKTAAMGTSALDLVAAGAYSRLGRLAEAADMARRAEQSTETDINQRATFIAGIVAARRSDSATLAASLQSLSSLPQPHSLDVQGDVAALQALTLLHTDPARAQELAAQAVELRRKNGDDRAMIHAMALEAQAAKAAGHPDVASALLARAAQGQAARSATTGQNDPLAIQYMNEAGLSLPLQPFAVKETDK
ncbi:hypothetical protein [Acetobacter estunensis]|uniref:hypothetical protein n=1 Tax=Acetobacter estunensis TaxID=104097 RepID=UPI0020C36229|nr:hypothetical protein [Acetobacter estunensis]